MNVRTDHTPVEGQVFEDIFIELDKRKALVKRLHGCGVCLAQYTDNPSR